MFAMRGGIILYVPQPEESSSYTPTIRQRVATRDLHRNVERSMKDVSQARGIPEHSGMLQAAGLHSVVLCLHINQ